MCVGVFGDVTIIAVVVLGSDPLGLTELPVGVGCVDDGQRTEEEK